jgi:hypothetical protein
MLLLALGAAGGCEISGSSSKVGEIPSFNNVQATADVDWNSIMSNYKAVINGLSPIQIDVALYSHDAKESQVQDPSCAANTRDTIRTGHYSFYLRSKENSVIADQSIDSFGNGLLEFNDQRKMIQF